MFGFTSRNLSPQKLSQVVSELRIPLDGIMAFVRLKKVSALYGHAAVFQAAQVNVCAALIDDARRFGHERKEQVLQMISAIYSAPGSPPQLQLLASEIADRSIEANLSIDAYFSQMTYDELLRARFGTTDPELKDYTELRLYSTTRCATEYFLMETRLILATAIGEKEIMARVAVSLKQLKAKFDALERGNRISGALEDLAREEGLR